MKRKQLTLFLEENESILIESIRKKYNPMQYRLIKSHITLCREDEIEDWDYIQEKLENIEMNAFQLKTNGLVRFSSEKGLLIDVQDQEGNFNKLRASILKSKNSVPRTHKAHITLIHPRNAICDDKAFNDIGKIGLPQLISIRKISLIEQTIGQEWKILKEYNLTASDD